MAKNRLYNRERNKKGNIGGIILKKYNLTIYFKKAEIERELIITAIIIDEDYIKIADYTTGETLIWGKNDIRIINLKDMEE